ncbi:MAG TPA: hypothetical protein VEI73_10995 [Candidatus Acidoferrum sp.]|nr:hypothetical protein [Candidatus Acidoferrum sp.]
MARIECPNTLGGTLRWESPLIVAALATVALQGALTTRSKEQGE